MATILRTRAVFANPSGGGDSLLTYYWDSAGGTPTQVMTEAQARVRAFWSSFVAQFPNTATVRFNPVGDEILEADGALVGQFTAATVADVVGTGGGDLLPLATQGLLRLGTSTFIGGRKVTGRQFIPGPLETINGGGRPQAAYITALGTAAALLGTTVVTPIAQRVWHRPKNGVGGLGVVVTSRTVSSEWAVQRRRRA